MENLEGRSPFMFSPSTGVLTSNTRSVGTSKRQILSSVYAGRGCCARDTLYVLAVTTRFASAIDCRWGTWGGRQITHVLGAAGG